MTYQHFSVRERERIQRGLWRKESIRAIARSLGRSHSSVLRELERVVPVNRYRYNARRAQERALVRRTSRGRTLRLKNATIRSYVTEHLKLRWSPEQIAGRMQKDGVGSISAEAIYQFIYAQIKNGKPKKGCVDLRPYLRHTRTRRVPHGARRCQRVLKPRGPSIDTRPKVVARRSRIGDWESDSIESSDHAPGLNSLVERKTGIVRLTKLRDKTAVATAEAVVSRLKGVSVHTITFDNGAENQRWHLIDRALGSASYFAHPYHSWERGTNENTNGLVRDYFPKKTDFRLVSADDIARVEYALNTRPRKRHGWRTPLEVWGGAVGS
jgi:IS30 family transposase